ncbi:MAG: hypothetical protein IJH14_02950 [Solobacterium sp.]|nr:hypothetical protein [Solobacterium sp.]
MENKKILQDETMASVSGGFIFADSKGQFCIVDDVGNILELFQNMADAQAYCEQNGISTQQISWEQVVKLRDEASKKRHEDDPFYPPNINPLIPPHK